MIRVVYDCVRIDAEGTSVEDFITTFSTNIKGSLPVGAEVTNVCLEAMEDDYSTSHSAFIMVYFKRPQTKEEAEKEKKRVAVQRENKLELYKRLKKELEL